MAITDTHQFEINSIILSVNRDNDGVRDSDNLKVTTGDGVIYLSVNTGQNCCENFGFFEDQGIEDALSMKGMLRRVELVTNDGEGGYDSGGTAFVRFHTDTDTVVVGVYNGHNGYYGHGVHFSYDRGEDTEYLHYDIYI